MRIVNNSPLFHPNFPLFQHKKEDKKGRLRRSSGFGRFTPLKFSVLGSRVMWGLRRPTPRGRTESCTLRILSDVLTSAHGEALGK